MVCYVCGKKETALNGHVKLDHKKEPIRILMYELCPSCLEKQGSLFSKMKKYEEKKPTSKNCFLCGKESPTNKMEVGSNACLLCQECIDSFVSKVKKAQAKHIKDNS